MNAKIVLSFFAGVVLTVAIILFLSLAIPYARAQENIRDTDTISDKNGTPLWDLANIFQKAGSEIQCQDTKQFYDKLVAEYSLGEVTVDISQQESTNAQSIIPDIRKIQLTAVTLPLHEAGKTITDEGLQEFYYSFLEDAGLLMSMPEEETR